MDRSYLRATREAEWKILVEALQKQQHIRPHQTVPQALANARQDVQFCAVAAEQAMNWLQLDAQKAIGRLRRSELLQLVKSIHRFWRQNTARPEPATQPQS